MTESETKPSARDRRYLARAAELYLIFLPAGHLLVYPVSGAMATVSDVALVGLLLVGVVWFVRKPDAWRLVTRERRRLIPYLLGIALMVLFGGWVALSGLWGSHARYAVLKGGATAAMAVGAALIGLSRLGWRRTADAWLVGTALALGLTLLAGLFGPDALRDRVIYSGGGVLGFPFPRISGPLLHPNMLGDYLVISGVLWWARWPEWSGRWRTWGGVLGAAMAAALFLSVSTAWIPAGVIIVLLSRDGAETSGLGRKALRTGGALLALGTLVATLVPLDLSPIGLPLESGGVRPAIWLASIKAFLATPVIGVGASPYLVNVPDPVTGNFYMWDAHNAYLSVLGQFGLVGMFLLIGAFLAVIRALLIAPESRARTAAMMALLAAGIHAFFLASEDMRYLWALVGVIGVVLGERSNRPVVGKASVSKGG